MRHIPCSSGSDRRRSTRSRQHGRRQARRSRARRSGAATRGSSRRSQPRPGCRAVRARSMSRRELAAEARPGSRSRKARSSKHRQPRRHALRVRGRVVRRRRRPERRHRTTASPERRSSQESLARAASRRALHVIDTLARGGSAAIFGGSRQPRRERDTKPSRSLEGPGLRGRPHPRRARRPPLRRSGSRRTAELGDTTTRLECRPPLARAGQVPPAVDRNRLAGDPARRVRRQEEDQIGDFAGLAGAAERVRLARARRGTWRSSPRPSRRAGGGSIPPRPD